MSIVTPHPHLSGCNAPVLRRRWWTGEKGEDRGTNGSYLTVDVMSAEQTSQTYFTPPSPPLAAVFFRMTPMFEGATRVGVIVNPTGTAQACNGL